MPITDTRLLKRTVQLSGAALPPRFAAIADRFWDDPKAMAQAVAKIVHEGFTDKEAYEFYRDTACVK